MNAAGCIIIYNNLVLLARRLEAKGVAYPGYWSIFAGSREPPLEPPMVCAIRELHEETGIYLKTNQIKFAKTLHTDRGNLLDLYYHVCKSMPSVNLNFEHTEYGWFDISKLKSFPYPIDTKIVNVIQSIDID